MYPNESSHTLSSFSRSLFGRRAAANGMCTPSSCSRIASSCPLRSLYLQPLTCQAYQEQMRLQQQHQQQTHITDGMHKNQRVQQHPAQQGQLAHQQNNMMPHQASGSNMTIPSPQQHHPVLGSPHANAQNNGRSPSQVPPRQAPTPVPDNMGTQNNVKTLMDSFPKLLELKRQGLLLPDQEKHVSLARKARTGRH